MSLNFSMLQLIAGTNNPSKEDIEKAFLGESTFPYKDTNYELSGEQVSHSIYWLYIKFGKSIPWTNEVYNYKNNCIESNPRKHFQSELNRQLFIIYDLNKNLLYTSNKNYKNLLEKLFHQRTQKDITIKNIYGDVDSFLKNVRNIKRIRMTRLNNLFTYEQGVFTDPDDIFGLGKPINATIELVYKKTRVTEKFIEFIRNAVTQKKQLELENLVCIGMDDNDFESIYNTETFIKTITINIQKDKFGLYPVEEVKKSAITAVKKSHV
jgi:hypothetical protein